MNVVLVIVNVPSLKRAPPKVLFPSMMLNPDMLTTVPSAMLNTSVVLLPLTVTSPAPGPSITSGPAISDSTKVAPSVIVCGVAKTVGSKVIVSSASSTLARLTAWRRLEVAGGRAGAVDGRVDDQGGLSLEGADVGCGVEREAALVSGDTAGGRALADGSAGRQERHGLGRPTVVAERGQAQVGEAGQDDVAVTAARDPARAAGADQVV